MKEAKREGGKMNEKDNRKTIDRDAVVEKLRQIKGLSLELTGEDIPQVKNNMELVLSLVNELLFLIDKDYERP
jgi:hypothetical protein